MGIFYSQSFPPKEIKDKGQTALLMAQKLMVKLQT